MQLNIHKVEQVRFGKVVHFPADTDVIHVYINGTESVNGQGEVLELVMYSEPGKMELLLCKALAEFEQDNTEEKEA